MVFRQQKHDSAVKIMHTRLKPTFFMLIFGISLCVEKSAFAQNEPVEAASWRDSVNEQVLPVKLPVQKLVRNIEMKNTPAVAVLTEICKRGGVKVITDRSLNNKRITAKFTNATLNEILSKVLESCSAHVKPLTDNVFLVEAVDAKNASYVVPKRELPCRTLPNQDSVYEQSLPSRPLPAAKYHKYGYVPPPPSATGFVPPPPP